jgi:diguanylate cyclase (GGDEF)-like protein
MSVASIPFVIDDQELERQELALAPVGAARLTGLVSLAWHLRQRDGRRAGELSQQAREMIAQRDADPQQARSTALRLTLVDAEVCWLLADYGTALRLASAAVEAAQQMGDGAIGADAHWIRAQVASDLGDTALRDISLQACEGLAQRLDDPQRALIARAAIARWAVFADPLQARERWAAEFADDKGPWPVGVATWVHDFLGNLAFSDGDNSPATMHRLRMHDDAVATGQWQRAVIALTNIGACFSNLNDHDSSLIWMQRGLDAARRLGSPMSIAGALCQVGGILPPLGRLDAALEMLQEARAMMSIAPRSRNLVIVLHYLAEVLNLQGRHAQAMDVLSELEERAAYLQQSDILMETRLATAVAMSALGQRDEALTLAGDTLAACREFKRRSVEIRVLMELARLRTQVRAGGPPASATDHAAALGYLREAVEVSKSIDGYQIAGELYDALALEHAHAGDYAVAYEVSRQAAQAREVTISTAALNRSIAMQIAFQTERTRADVELHRSLATTLQRTTATLESLGVIGQEITRHLDEKAVFDILQTHVHGLLDATHFSIWQLNEAGDGMLLAFGVDHGQPMQTGRRIALDNPSSNIARCARTREVSVRREAVPGFNPNHIPGTIPSSSALFAPLVVGDNLLGVMSIQSPQADVYGERERLIFRTLSAYGAIGLHNARAYKRLGAALGELHVARDELANKNKLLEVAYLQQQQASFTDPLTQLRNRRFLMEHIEDEVALTLRRFERQRRQAPTDLVPDHDLIFFMIDVDHFKAVNDTHGHATGDDVLVEVAQRLRGVVRETDFLIRWGGEEFLLVARATHADEGPALAERLCGAVAARPFDLGGGRLLTSTCSIGFAGYPFYPHEPRLANWSEITRLADQALYLAKKEGRNRWIGFRAAGGATDRTHFEQVCRDPEAAEGRGGLAILRGDSPLTAP